MFDSSKLEWLDVSHNLISTIDEGLLFFTSLKSVYLHANKIASFKEVEKLARLSNLQTLTLHGNPIAGSLQTYRMYCIGIKLSRDSSIYSEVRLSSSYKERE